MPVGRVIVIGSGPAGAAAARELVRQRVPVTMLESGSAPPVGTPGPGKGPQPVPPRPRGPVRSGSPSWPPGTRTRSGRSTSQPGGLSNQWTGAVPRFAPDDFIEGERLHERYRWPVTYDELVPVLRGPRAAPRHHRVAR